MKHYYLSIFIATLMSMACNMASAHDIAKANSDGKTIYYNYNSDGSSVSVTYEGTFYDNYYNEYTGAIVIPKTVTYSGKTYSVTRIGEDAFYGCSLTSVTIPNRVTCIGDRAFYNCSGLTSVTIPNSVTSIGNYAFFYCSGLTSVTIPNSVTRISEDAFYCCSGLTSVTIPNSVTSIDSGAFEYCSGLTSVTIPNSVTSIGNYAFFHCSGLASVTIGNSVTSIGSSAFSGCSGLASVTIGNSVTSIGSSAFSGCSGLTSVTIPNSVTSIGTSAFYNTRIKSLTIGSGMQTIAPDAFSCYYSGAKPIKVIWLANTPPSGYKDVGGTINYVPNDSYSGLSNRKIYPFLSSMFEVDGIKYVPVSPSERTCDAIDCVYNESAENTKISNTVTYKNINMTVQSVGDSICTGNFYIKNLEYLFDSPIGLSAFSDCSGLTSVTIPNSVTSIGSSAFSGCSGLQKVIVPNIKNWCSIKFGDSTANPLSYAHHLYSDENTEITKLFIPDDVTSIGSDAFSGCSGLTSVTIPNSVTTISSSAFSGCSGLNSVTIGNSVTSIGSYAFKGCSGLTAVRFENSKDNTPIVLENNMVFSDCPLDEVYIGRKLSYTTTSSAGYSPFYKKTTLRSVKFTDKETEISDYEFYGCTNLTDVSMGDGVKSIGAYAFSGCSSLEQFTCGRQLESIGKEAFSDCTSMTKFKTRAAVPPTCGAQALDDINKWECTLYVPTESIDDYQAADQWKNFFFIEKFRMEGDCNGDDAVTMADANAVVNYFLAKGTDGFVEGDFDEEAADVNGDGEITMADANQIVNMFLGSGKE